MNVNLIVSATAVLVGLMVGLVFYLQSQSDDASYLVKSKWSVTTADGVAQTWLIDSESGAISISSAEDGTATVQEFHGGKQYTYFAGSPETDGAFDATEFCAGTDYEGDCAVLASEQEHSLKVMNEVLVGVKSGCYEEKAHPVSTTISSNGNLNVGGFRVSMVNGSPSAILDHAGNSIATINNIENVEEVKLTGCDTSGDATWNDALANLRDSRRKLGEVSEEVQIARSFLDNVMLEHMAKEDVEEAARHLADGVSSYSGGGSGTSSGNSNPYFVIPTCERRHLALFDASLGTPLCQGKGNRSFDRIMTRTNWCGAWSNRSNTPCPGGNGAWVKGAKNGIFRYDAWTDNLCRRHDHGTYFTRIKPGVRLGCKIDSDLALSTMNTAVRAIFGPSGKAALYNWGCFDKGTYHKWVLNGWWGFQYKAFYGVFIKKGSNRYQNVMHHFGYWKPYRNCPTDWKRAYFPAHAPPANYWWETDYGTNPTNAGGTAAKWCGQFTGNCV